MAGLVRELDWARTPLGPPDSWSPALRMIVGLMVANRVPLLLWWGPDYISIYNDAYRPALGAKHPWALGKPFRECWPEIRHILEPLIDAPFSGGPAERNSVGEILAEAEPSSRSSSNTSGTIRYTSDMCGVPAVGCQAGSLLGNQN